MTGKTVRSFRMVSLMLMGLLLVGTPAADTQAKEGNPGVPGVGDQQGNSPKPEAAKELRVSKVEGKLRLGSTITVTVDGLVDYLKKPNKEPKKFIPYLDWRPLKKVNARWVSGTDQLKFDMERTSESESEWNALLGRPFSKDKGSAYSVAVSVAYEGEKAIPTDVGEYRLIVLSKGRFFLFLIFVAAVFGFFVGLAKHSSIIRDSYAGLPGRQRTYSLGRTQMAFWFFVVAAAYGFIWLTTCNVQSLTGSALILIGISAGTGLSSAAVSSTKRSAAESKLGQLSEEKKQIEARLGQLTKLTATQPAPSDLDRFFKEQAEKEGRLEQVDKAIPGMEAELEPEISEGFFRDILSDANGISLHRFQILVWSLILGIIFVVSTWKSMTMPEFNETLLTLMGISSGTYIGFKFPEKQG